MIKAEEDGQLLFWTKISNLRPEKIHLPEESIGDLIKVSKMTEDDTVKSLVETLEKLPDTKLQELTKVASFNIRKLVVTEMKERRRLIHEQVNWNTVQISHVKDWPKGAWH